MVVLDTRKGEPAGTDVEEKAPVSVRIETTAPLAAAPPVLSDYLSPGRVLIWDRPVEKDAVLRALAEVAVAGNKELDPGTVFDEIVKREKQGSTFFNEGVALPHARIEKLVQPIIAIGVMRKGISDVSTEKPIEYVFLILSPVETPETQVRILGAVSRASRNRQLAGTLALCRTPADVFTAIRDWETLQRL